MLFDIKNSPKPPECYARMSDFAKILGITKQSLHEKLATGRLDGTWYTDIRNHIWFDIELAKRCLEYQTTREINNQKTKKEGYKPIASSSAPSGDEKDMPDNVKSNIAYNRARSANEVLKMQTLQIELDKLKGTLVPMEQVKREQFLLARVIRDAMIGIPDRISAQLAASREEREVHALLLGEIKAALKASELTAREELNASSK